MNCAYLSDMKNISLNKSSITRYDTRKGMRNTRISVAMACTFSTRKARLMKSGSTPGFTIDMLFSSREMTRHEFRANHSSSGCDCQRNLLFKSSDKPVTAATNRGDILGVN